MPEKRPLQVDTDVEGPLTRQVTPDFQSKTTKAQGLLEKGLHGVWKKDIDSDTLHHLSLVS